MMHDEFILNPASCILMYPLHLQPAQGRLWILRPHLCRPERSEGSCRWLRTGSV